jgi:glutathione synthase
MHWLYVIDPLESLNLETETSLLIMEEAARRGHESSVTTIDDLYVAGDEARAATQTISLDLTARPFYRLGPLRDTALAAYDLVLMRKDPPVDATYIGATLVLEYAATGVPVVNDPVSLRSINEKLFPLSFPGLHAPTLLTNDARRVRNFVAAQGRSVFKPLEDCSGRGIRILTDQSEVPAELGGAFVVVQRFIDAVVEGDKRLFLLNGAVLGAVNRIPRNRDALANIHQGATVAATTVTPRDREIVAAVGPELVRRGIWMAGLDVIGGYLTEINVTSPSAARQINAVSGIRIERAIVDFLEAKAREGKR